MRHFCQCFSMTLSINPDFELDLKEFAWSVLCLSWLSLSLHGNNGQLLFMQHKINSSIRWLDLWWRPPATSHHEYAGIMVGTRMKGGDHITQGGKKPERWRYQPLSYEGNFLMRTNRSPMRISINAFWRQRPRWPPIRLCSSWAPSPPAITYGRPIF